MRKGMVKTSLLVCLMIVILSTSAIADPLSSVGVQEGDEVTYKFGKTYFEAKENDVTYLDESDFNLEDKKVKVRIDSLFVVYNDWMLIGETFGDYIVAVNTTETFEGSQYESKTYVDYWYSLFYLLRVGYEAQVKYFDPYYYEFDPPDPMNESLPPYTAFQMPIFASTNVSFYEGIEQQWSQTLIEEKNENLNNNIKLMSEFLEVAYWEDKNEFYLNTSYHAYRTNDTETPTPWEIDGKFNYVVHVDTLEGLVKDLQFSFGYNLKLGSNQTFIEIVYEIKKDRIGNTIQLNAPWLEVLIISIGMVFVLRLKKKK